MLTVSQVLTVYAFSIKLAEVNKKGAVLVRFAFFWPCLCENGIIHCCYSQFECGQNNKGNAERILLAGKVI